MGVFVLKVGNPKTEAERRKRNDFVVRMSNKP